MRELRSWLDALYGGDTLYMTLTPSDCGSRIKVPYDGRSVTTCSCEKLPGGVETGKRGTRDK